MIPTWNQSLSVVIPAYNEEAYIEKCVVSREAVLKDTVTDFEIIVVNDGSRDSTATVHETLQLSRPHFSFKLARPAALAEMRLVSDRPSSTPR